ncbi:hypothetical protein, partial [Enterobacter roggenkampii]|uniref:hypothetical protein n=1 Tax=Enterobacter roggenkampii TaxID=1812935 RepID=UPI00197A96CA
GAGRTSEGNGSHASTLKSPSYTKSVSWQHYPSDESYWSGMVMSHLPGFFVPRVVLQIKLIASFACYKHRKVKFQKIIMLTWRPEYVFIYCATAYF